MYCACCCLACKVESSEHRRLCVQGWCRGNVTIIGDAAHAGLPNGQGLNLAIEDGEALLFFKCEPCIAQMFHTKHYLGVNPVKASLQKGGVALDSVFLDR
jgi:hypothetical protein